MARDPARGRAVSITVNHVLAIGIATVLMVGMFAATGDFVDGQIQEAGESELRVIGERLAAEIQIADRIAQRGGEATVTITQPARVSTGVYAVDIVQGSACDTSRFTATHCLKLETDVNPVTVKVPIVNSTVVHVRAARPGEFVITAEPATGVSSAGADVGADVGIDIGVGRNVSVGGGERVSLSARPPVAKYDVSPGSPTTNSVVVFEATAVDPDGTITKYEWDVDGNGVVDGRGERFEFSYSEAGVYNVTLTVTDSQGKTDTVSKVLVVGGIVYNHDVTAMDYDGDGTAGGVQFSLSNRHDDATITHVSIEPHDDSITEIDENQPGNTHGRREILFDPDGDAPSGVDETLSLTRDGRIVDLTEHGAVTRLDGGADVTVSFAEFGDGASQVDMTGTKVDVFVRYYVQDGTEETYFVSKFTLFSPAGRQPPDPQFTYSCNERHCSFDASGSGDPDGTITNYDWSFGTGASETGATTAHTYSSNGSYTVTLSVTDDDGVTSTKSKRVVAGSVDFEMNVNFQPQGVTTPSGYLADTGKVYGPRGNGHTYGWNQTAGQTRHRNAHPDQRYDTLTHVDDAVYGSDREWEAAVPNGKYRVTITMGDPSYSDQTNVVTVEGERIVDPDPYPSAPNDDFDRYVAVVEVTDGKVTVAPGTGSHNAKLNFLTVERLDPRPFEEESGTVVVEAEHFGGVRQGTDVDNGPGDGDDMRGFSFAPVTGSDVSGTALVATPNSGASAGATRNGQRLDYTVDFETTGTYYVWVRMNCPTDDDRSIHVGLDGAVQTYDYGLMVGCEGASGYTWVSQEYEYNGGWTTQPVTVDVSTPGTRTVSIWMRQDGVSVDKILLTTDPTYTPSGTGPDESERSA